MGTIDHILSAFYNQPLAILPDKAEEIRAFLSARMRGVETHDRGESLAEQKKNRLTSLMASVQSVDPMALRRQDDVIIAGRVAVMPIFGTLAKRVSAIERASGGISTEEIGHALDGLVNDKQIKAIVQVWDSPGGSVFGLRELSDRMRAARDQKKIVGMVDTLAASAALWLVSQSSEVVAAPQSQIGSHGVIAVHEDMSAFQEKLGVRMTIVTSSEHKATGNPYEPLSAAGRAELEKSVQYFHQQFTEDLAKGRGFTENRVEKTFGAGKLFNPEEAKERGMIDRIDTLESTLRRLGANESVRARAMAKADVDLAIAEKMT